jgi:hypothetical protein
MTAPVFLSASEPDPRRSAEYWDSRKLLNVREAVRAFCGHALPHFPVVFGGHPAITPLVRSVADRTGYDARLQGRLEGVTAYRPRILMFQSGLFVDRPDSAEEIVTEPLDEDGRVTPRKSGMRNESLLSMRYAMIGKPTSQLVHPLLQKHAEGLGVEREKRLGTYEFSAAIFIGGMEGVVREFRIFRTFHPDTPAYPIGSTGSACDILLREVAGNLRPDLLEALRDETAYSLLMQQILPVRKEADTVLGWRGNPRRWFDPKEHIDPEDINRRFPLRESHQDGGHAL